MTAPVYEIRRAIVRLSCSACGAEANASCDCAKPYMPAPARAAAAVSASPGKSDRALAAEVGVHRETIAKARKELAGDQPVERIGRDGKTRRMPRLAIVDDDEMPTEQEADQSHQEALYDQACLILERMSGETRQKLFAYLKEAYK